MTTTAKDIIQRAMGGRTANDPDDLATVPELIEVLEDDIQQLYGDAGSVNPWFFSHSHTVTGSGAAWGKPEGSTRILYVHGGGNAGTGADAVLSGNADPLADRVSVIPVHDFEAELPPRIYRLGESYYSVGAAGDPSPSINGDRLTFISADVHADLDPSLPWDDAANTLQASWPEEHNKLLIAMMRRYLAEKDGRDVETERLTKRVEKLKLAFLARVSLADAHEVMRHSQ